MGRCLAHQIGFSLLVTILVCLWIAPRRSLCSDYWDVTPNYCNGTRYDFSDDEIEAIVNVHNEIRAAVGATNMLKLVSARITVTLFMVGNSLLAFQYLSLSIAHDLV